MERGLIWLPLLGLFFWLAWQGRNEFQKVEAYQNWAQQFEKSKYDLYAVLGQNGKELTWGKPTRTGPIDLKTFSLERVREIRLLVEEKPVALETPPNKGKAIALEFIMQDSQDTVRIPFTEIPIAVEWGQYLLKKKN
ncbi:hypothetical protein [Scytonema millei]|uniref:Uncharacterized protein n=1 Tax=Scytonema millei VB511283 TaxID=1245923 RepID=A0A9X5E800_9CYAN|nr:hypothetical protein [Scytonema millei]NHC36819.1 hypothetical protein [Scytonema millei VB511283]